MDPLTHTLLGATLARTRLGTVTPLAGPALIVGANLPDVDVLSFIAGADAAVGFRRGWTHGPIALVLLPIAWSLILIAFDRRRARGAPSRRLARPGVLVAITFLGCLTHPLLDWLNTYGIRFLMPFDDRWFYGDAMFIVDPWIWLVLGGAVFLTRDRSGAPWGWVLLAVFMSLPVVLVGARIPAAARIGWFIGLAAIAWLDWRSTRSRPHRTAEMAALLASTYILFLVSTTTLGAWWTRAELQRQGIHDVQRLLVGPTPANPFRWGVVVETPKSYVHGSLGWLPRPTLKLSPDPILRQDPTAIVKAALDAPQVQGAVNWMRFPFVEVDETSDGYTVHILDARYVRSRTEGFGAVVVHLDRGLRPR